MPGCVPHGTTIDVMKSEAIRLRANLVGKGVRRQEYQMMLSRFCERV